MEFGAESEGSSKLGSLKRLIFETGGHDNEASKAPLKNGNFSFTPKLKSVLQARDKILRMFESAISPIIRDNLGRIRV